MLSLSDSQLIVDSLHNFLKNQKTIKSKHWKANKNVNANQD